MSLLCDYCGRDLDEIWQCNMSAIPFSVKCEDCHGRNNEHDRREEEQETRNCE